MLEENAELSFTADCYQLLLPRRCNRRKATSVPFPIRKFRAKHQLVTVLRTQNANP